MNRHLLTLHEKFSKRWPSVAVLSSISAVVLYVFSIIESEILLSGYLKLASFVLFSVAVFSFFKLRDGRISIKIEKENDGLRFDYFLRNKNVSSESLPTDKIYDLKTERMPDSSLYTEMNRSDRTICYREKDSGDWRYLIQYNSRVIPLTKDDADLAVNVLEEHFRKR